MSEGEQRPIVGYVIITLFIVVLLFLNRDLFITFLRQPQFLIISLVPAILYVASRNKTSTPAPMYGTEDHFSATINLPNISNLELKDEIHKWIETKRIFGTIYLLKEEENLIKIKSPVRFMSSMFGARWTPNQCWCIMSRLSLKEIS